MMIGMDDCGKDAFVLIAVEDLSSLFMSTRNPFFFHIEGISQTMSTLYEQIKNIHHDEKVCFKWASTWTNVEETLLDAFKNE
jgi:hypothetical protein